MEDTEVKSEPLRFALLLDGNVAMLPDGVVDVEDSEEETAETLAQKGSNTQQRTKKRGCRAGRQTRESKDRYRARREARREARRSGRSGEERHPAADGDRLEHLRTQAAKLRKALDKAKPKRTVKKPHCPAHPPPPRLLMASRAKAMASPARISSFRPGSRPHKRRRGGADPAAEWGAAAAQSAGAPAAEEGAVGMPPSPGASSSESCNTWFERKSPEEQEAWARKHAEWQKAQIGVTNW